MTRKGVIIDVRLGSKYASESYLYYPWYLNKCIFRIQKTIVLSMAQIIIISTCIMYHRAVTLERGQEQKQVVVGCSRWIDTSE